MRTSTEVAKYIEHLLRINNMTAAELARRTGMNRSTMSRYFKGDRKIPMDELPKFAKALGVQPEELLIKNTTSNATESTIEDYDDCLIPVDLYGEVYCGEGEVHYGYPIDTIETPSEWLNGGEYFYLIAKGDSMVGAKIHEDDLLLIRKQPMVENGEIAVVIVDNKRMLKRVYKTDDTFTLVSENPKYPPINYRPNVNENIRILGKLKKSITNF